MKNLKLQILIVIMLISLSEFSFSQSKKPEKIENFNRSVNIIENNKSTGIVRATELEENIRSQRLAGNKIEAESLQTELLNKYEVTRDNSEIKIVTPVKANYFNPAAENSPQTNITRMDSSFGYSCHNTVSEQIGPNNGRIWNVSILDAMETTTRDSIRIIYSDDNGINWNHFATYLWSFPHFYNIEASVDVEIAISSYTNDKMLFIIFSSYGYYNGNYTGHYLGLVRVDVGNNPGICSQQLFNYGLLIPNHEFMYPCITSDNATFTYMPYIHICSYENYYDLYGNTIRAIRYAAIINTFDIYSSIYYSNTAIYTFAGYQERYLDMCAFTNQNIDYVFFVDASRVNSEKDITVVQYTVYNALSGGFGLWSMLGNSVRKIKDPHVAADGTNIMIVSTYEYNQTDNDILYYRSSTGIFGFNTSGFIDNSAMFEYVPRIVSEWNGNGRFLISYQKQNTYGYSAIYFASNALDQGQSFSKMISSDEFFMLYPHYSIPVKTRDNECLVTWTNYGINYNWHSYSSRGCSGNIAMTKSLNLKLFIQGFYLKTFDRMSIADTIRVYLRNSSSPYNIIDSAKAEISKQGNASVNFAYAQADVEYFISIRHRNSVETWSKTGEIHFESNSLSYDFSLSKTKAFGENQKLVDDSPVAFAIFNGDVNQDGTVDVTDAAFVDNGVHNFVMGYTVTDVNGDNSTDLSDAAIVDNNSFNYVSKIIP